MKSREAGFARLTAITLRSNRTIWTHFALLALLARSAVRAWVAAKAGRACGALLAAHALQVCIQFIYVSVYLYVYQTVCLSINQLTREPFSPTQKQERLLQSLQVTCCKFLNFILIDLYPFKSQLSIFIPLVAILPQFRG